MTDDNGKKGFDALADKNLSATFTAKAVYDLGGKEPPLVNFRDVVFSLFYGKPKGLVTTDLREVIHNPEAYSPSVLNLLTGDSSSGFVIGIVAALDDAGKKTFLPVVFDNLRDMQLIAGPAALEPGAAQSLKRAGLHYVDASSAGAVDAFNEFIVQGAVYRGEKDLLNAPEARDLVEHLVSAAAMTGLIPPLQAQGDGQQIIPAASTLGGLFIEAMRQDVQPALYVAAAKNTGPGVK